MQSNQKTDCTVGVPQGGVLSPLCFTSFINSITNPFISILHKYADDLQIYFQTSIDIIIINVVKIKRHNYSAA